MSHPPPYRALEAMHVGRLRPSHLRVVEHHLAACEPCRTALACIATYERVSGEFRALEPAIDWDTVSHGAMRAIRRKRDQRVVFIGVTLVAAAAAVMVMATPTQRPSATTTQPPALIATRAETAPVIDHASGAVVIDGTALSVRQSRPRTLRDGSVLETSQGSLRVSLGTGTGFELGPSTVVRLDAIRAPIALSLESGRVSSEVRPGTAYEVRAGSYVIRVRGTRFDVARAGDRVSVHLHTGRVEVVENGVSLGVLVAPATWTSPEATEAEVPAPAPAVRPRATTSTRVAATPEATTTVVPASDAADVAFAMRRHAGVLSRCIAADAEPVSFTIHFSVGTMGNIRDVSLSSRSEVPTTVSDCVLRTVQGFRVPAPDDPLDLSLPITLP